MDLMRLKHFVAVADSESISAAARKLGISQPALSVHIQRLERSLGVDLVSRVGRVSQLTELGLEFLPRAREILALCDSAKIEIADRRDGRVGMLRLGLAPGGFGGPGLKRLRSLLARDRAIRLDVVEVSLDAVSEAFASSRIDAWLGETAQTVQLPNLTVLASSPLEILVSKKHRLANMPDCGLPDLVGEAVMVSERVSSGERGFLNFGASQFTSLEIIRVGNSLRDWRVAAGLGLGIAGPYELITLGKEIKRIPFREVGCDCSLAFASNPARDSQSVNLLRQRLLGAFLEPDRE